MTTKKKFNEEKTVEVLEELIDIFREKLQPCGITRFKNIFDELKSKKAEFQYQLDITKSRKEKRNYKNYNDIYEDAKDKKDFISLCIKYLNKSEKTAERDFYRARNNFNKKIKPTKDTSYEFTIKPKSKNTDEIFEKYNEKDIIKLPEVTPSFYKIELFEQLKKTYGKLNSKRLSIEGFNEKEINYYKNRGLLII